MLKKGFCLFMVFLTALLLAGISCADNTAETAPTVVLDEVNTGSWIVNNPNSAMTVAADYYARIAVPEYGKVTIQVENPDITAVSKEISIFYGSSSTSNSIACKLNSDNSMWEGSAILQPGTYTFRMELMARMYVGNVSFKYSFSLSTPSPYEEREPNNTKSTAQELTPEHYYDCTYSHGTGNDVFCFNVKKGEYWKLKLQSTSSSLHVTYTFDINSSTWYTWAIYTTDEQGNTRSTNFKDDDGEIYYPIPVNKDGICYLEVSYSVGYPLSTIPYQIGIFRASDTIIDKSTGASYSRTEYYNAVSFHRPASSSATKIIIPDTIIFDGVPCYVTGIDDNALKGMKSLKEVSIGANVTSIGKNAFSGCAKLTKISGGNKLNTVGASAFASCKKLKTIPNFANLTSIADNTFKGCAALTSFDIGTRVSNIGKNAFNGCTKLTRVTGGAALTTIGDNAFSSCKKLKSVANFQKLTTIGTGAFKNCTALTGITLCNQVSKIGKEAFSGCKKLKAIKIEAEKLTNKSIGSNAFKGISSSATISCPSGKLKNYQKILLKKGVNSTVTIK